MSATPPPCFPSSASAPRSLPSTPSSSATTPATAASRGQHLRRRRHPQASSRASPPAACSRACDAVLSGYHRETSASARRSSHAAAARPRRQPGRPLLLRPRHRRRRPRRLRPAGHPRAAGAPAPSPPRTSSLPTQFELAYLARHPVDTEPAASSCQPSPAVQARHGAPKAAGIVLVTSMPHGPDTPPGAARHAGRRPRQGPGACACPSSRSPPTAPGTQSWQPSSSCTCSARRSAPPAALAIRSGSADRRRARPARSPPAPTSCCLVEAQEELVRPTSSGTMKPRPCPDPAAFRFLFRRHRQR